MSQTELPRKPPPDGRRVTRAVLDGELTKVTWLRLPKMPTYCSISKGPLPATPR